MIVGELEAEGPPCIKDQKGRYDFKCVNQLCPYGMDASYCYKNLSDELRELFEELFELRATLTKRSEMEMKPECVQQT